MIEPSRSTPTKAVASCGWRSHNASATDTWPPENCARSVSTSATIAGTSVQGACAITTGVGDEWRANSSNSGVLRTIRSVLVDVKRAKRAHWPLGSFCVPPTRSAPLRRGVTSWQPQLAVPSLEGVGTFLKPPE